MTALIVSGLRKILGEGAGAFELQADFQVPMGARAVLEGASGGGKTTLLRLIAGLEGLDAGEVRIGEENLNGLLPEARRIGTVFQDHCLFSSLSVLDNATFGLRMKGIGKADRDREAQDWLSRVGLGRKLSDPVTTLSGGEKSRVAFVRALLPRPRVLLLDEPFAALDPELRAGLRGELLELHSRHPVPLVLVTHDPQDARSIGTLQLGLKILDEGRVRKIVAL